MRLITYIILTIIILLGLSFACLNAEPVVINYYIGQAKTPLSFLLVIAFSSGVIIGLLAGTIKLLKLKRLNSQLNYRVNMAEKELTNLRIMPLKDSP